LSYVEQLYPDAKDEDGCQVLIKINGRPSKLDIDALAELRA